MALELSLREICSNLTSIRATERKKSAETLKDMLNRTAVPSLLNENTLKKSGYTWNHVFGDINDYILKETEKFETNKNFSVIVGIATSLLNLCVSASNKGGAYIKCDAIMDACSNIFNDTRLRKAIGDAYFNVLYKHVLNNDYFIGYITPDMWENLLDISVTTCLTKLSQLDNLTKFKFLLLVIQNASNSSQCFVCLRDALPDIKNCFRNVIHDKIVQEFVLKTVLLLMELLASECRLYICEFSETLLPSLFKIYDHSMDVKKKSLLFKVLQVAFVIHHPMGRLQKEEGSMAHNWEIWNKHVHSILEIVCLEINNMHKNLKHSSSHAHVDNFSYLAAITYYQILNENSSEVVEEIGENSAKKQKLSFDNKKTFFDLLEELQQNSETWISIIHMYVKHFGNTLSPSHFMKLLNICEILVSKTAKSFNWVDFGKMTCLVLDYFTMNAKLTVDISGQNDFISLWNTCVRNSAIQNAAHESIHMIILSLLKLDVIKYTHVQPLLTIYFEKRMPVDNHTLKTLSSLHYKFFSNCCQIEQRHKCFTWLTHVDIIDIDVKYIEEIFVQIISNDNFPLAQHNCLNAYSNSMHDILFKNIENSILFGTFDYEIESKEKGTANEKELIGAIEINREVSDWIIKYLENELSEFITTTATKDEPVKIGKYIHLTLLLYKSLLKYKILTKEDVLSSSLYVVLIESLKKIFVVFTRVIKSSEQIKNKIALLNCLQNILENDYNSFLDSVIRSCISEDCFHCINEILKTEVSHDDEEYNGEDDIELSLAGLRHHCIYFLSAYCSHDHDYTDEVIKCILDEDVYKFESHWDIECALRCIRMIIKNDRDNKFIDYVLGLMQTMCRNLFRNSKASFEILQIILQILDRVWEKNDHVLRQNCIIMVRSYTQRCMKMYYPPRVAVLVYECVARIIELNNKHHIDIDDSLQDVLIEQLTGNIHIMRIYCCYLMKYACGNNSDIKNISNTLMQIFVINVSNNNETVLKDETTNRTLTISHCFRALSQFQPYLIHDIVLKLIHIQKKKGLSKLTIKKVLNIILNKSMGINLEEYADMNVKRILQYWFKEEEGFQDMPLSLLGFKSIDAFIEKHLKWLIAMDILWRNNGYIEKSEATKYVVNKSGKSLEDIIEICFCSIIALCLPYIVTKNIN
ncbi:unnamed protein product [Colias eurytheme]|nr:unnamed protein product [Colias eurytheme]